MQRLPCPVNSPSHARICCISRQQRPAPAPLDGLAPSRNRMARIANLPVVVKCHLWPLSLYIHTYALRICSAKPGSAAPWHVLQSSAQMPMFGRLLNRIPNDPRVHEAEERFCLSSAHGDLDRKNGGCTAGGERNVAVLHSARAERSGHTRLRLRLSPIRVKQACFAMKDHPEWTVLM